MLRGMEDFENSRFDNLKDVEGAILGVFDHELEIFDPICDGDVRLSEGMAYLREQINDFFKLVESNPVTRELYSIDESRLFEEQYTAVALRQAIDLYTNAQGKIKMDKATETGYRDGFVLLEKVLNEIEDVKSERKFAEMEEKF